MTASQRIRKIIDTKKITIKFFCEQTGISRDTLNQMFKNDSDPKLPLLQGCLREFPNLNERWLILGEGEMWKEEESSKLEQEVKGIKGQLKNIEKDNKDLYKLIIERLK
jgi:transcriptional regulator with XRE-family HTH domain